MLLSVKQNGRRVNELRFKKGPIYIGRQMGSQVFLPKTGVSRQHAVIYTNSNGQWIVEDLDSVNKTFVNNDAIHTCIIKDGDKIDIDEFSIDIKLSQEQEPEKKHPTIHLDDTVISDQPDINAEIISPEASHAAPVKFPVKRLNDIYNTALALHNANSLQEIHKELVSILLSQFASHSTWVAVRKEDKGDMAIEGGRHKNRETVKRNELYVINYINQAVQKHQNILIPQLPRQIAQNKLRSVIIAPIMSHKHCYGYLYVNNSKEHEHYDNADLQYLMVVATLAAAAINS